MRGLNPQEVAEMLEGMKVQITLLKQHRVQDQDEVTGREQRLESDNATLMSALARGIEQQEALKRATVSQQADIATPVAEARRTVHVGVNLFLEGMRDERLPPLP